MTAWPVSVAPLPPWMPAADMAEATSCHGGREFRNIAARRRYRARNQTYASERPRLMPRRDISLRRERARSVMHESSRSTARMGCGFFWSAASEVARAYRRSPFPIQPMYCDEMDTPLHPCGCEKQARRCKTPFPFAQVMPRFMVWQGGLLWKLRLKPAST
jgi:hypothetical protein